MGKKKNKVVDLKPKVEKVSEEHLIMLQKAVNNVNGIQFEIGKIEAQKHSYLHRLSSSQEEIKSMQSMLVEEYGTFDVNLTDGTLNHRPDDE